MNKRLFTIYKHAKENVPFYSNLYKDTYFNEKDFFINDLPLVSKNLLLDSEYSNISNIINNLDYTSIAHIPTSGSTGKFLDVMWRDKEYQSSLLPLWVLRKKRYQITPRDKLCCFFTNQYDGKNIVNCEDVFYYKNRMLIKKSNLTPDNLKVICKKILDFSPKWMILQPSVAVLLCQCIEDNNYIINDELKYIELTGEKIFPQIRNYIKNTFKCFVANQYGCNEVNSIAYECRLGNLHILQECNHIEIIKNRKICSYEEEGDIYVTSLCNCIMPFIRYETGDRGIMYPSSICSCGCKSPVLKILTGRNSDWIISKHGLKTNVNVFVRSFEIINSIMDDVIRQFQVIQEDYDVFVIKLVVEKDIVYDSEIINYLKQLFFQTLEEKTLLDSHFIFEFCDQLFPDEKSNKHKLLISKINNM